MKQLSTILGLFLVMTFAAGAAETAKEIDVSGTLRVVSVKSTKSNKSTLRVYLEDAKGKKTQIRLKLADKSQTPKVKPLKDKQVQIVGKGTTQVRGKTSTITLTEIEKFAEVKAVAAE